MIKNIRIVDSPKFIIVCKLGLNYIHYHMNNRASINRYDIGIWRIKRKKGA